MCVLGSCSVQAKRDTMSPADSGSPTPSSEVASNSSQSSPLLTQPPPLLRPTPPSAPPSLLRQPPPLQTRPLQTRTPHNHPPPPLIRPAVASSHHQSSLRNSIGSSAASGTQLPPSLMGLKVESPHSHWITQAAAVGLGCWSQTSSNVCSRLGCSRGTGSRSGQYLESVHTEEESRCCVQGARGFKIHTLVQLFRHTVWVGGVRDSVRQVKWVKKIPIKHQDSYRTYPIVDSPRTRKNKTKQEKKTSVQTCQIQTTHTHLPGLSFNDIPQRRPRSHSHTVRHDQLQKRPLTENISTWTKISRWRTEPLDVIHWIVMKCLDNWITGFLISMATAEHLQLCYTDDATQCLRV